MGVSPRADLRTDNLTGALWVLLAALFFSFMVLAVRLASEQGATTLNIAMTRSAAGIPLVGFVALCFNRSAFWPGKFGTLAVRGILNVGAQILMLHAFTLLPLVLSNTISFTRPLFVLIFAVMLLGEKLGPRRIISMLIGFAGVVVMLEPWKAAVAYNLMGVVSAIAGSVFFALSIVLVRSMSASLSNTALLLWSSIFTTLLILPLYLFFYEPVTLQQLPYLAAVALFGIAAQAAYIQGLRAGEASVVNIVDYTRLIFVALLAYIFLQEVPSWATWIGSLIIVTAALYITWREAQFKQAGKITNRAPIRNEKEG